MSNRSCPSYRRTSKSRALPGVLKYTARHSMLKTRLGAVPVVEVNMPQPPAKAEHPAPTWSVRRSSQYGMMALLKVVVGRQVLAKIVELLESCKLPLEL